MFRSISFAVLTLCVVSRSFCQEPFGSGYAPNAVPVQSKSIKQYPPAKLAKNLSFDPKVKVRLWLQEKQGPHAVVLISENGNKIEDHIVQYGKPISLEGCFFSGTIWHDVSDELQKTRETEIDTDRPQHARNDWQPLPIPGVAIRVVFERLENRQRYRSGPDGEATPKKDWTILMDSKGRIFGVADSRAFATYDIRQDIHELGGLTNSYDYRAPLK